MPFRLASQIMLYAVGSIAPETRNGEIALPQMTAWDGAAIFGDGSHPTTRLCAAAVDSLCRKRTPAAFLDVGTGTGVLARIARARGASFVVGTDIDSNALACAQVSSNLDAHRIPIHLGLEAPDHWGARFDLVVANILEAPLMLLAPALGRSLLPGGVLILSGFTRPQTPALRVQYEHAGLRFVTESRMEEWVLLMFEQVPPQAVT
jgi:ribosomal protein L11 methyltransferase